MNLGGPELLLILIAALVVLAIIGGVVFVAIKLATRSKR